MECVQIALLTAIFVPTTLAQHIILDATMLNISLSNSSTDLETTLTKLKLHFDTKTVTRLILNKVDMQNRKDFFKNQVLETFCNLTQLQIENGNIEFFPENTFAKWNNSQIKDLYLMNIRLKNLSKSLLRPFSRLVVLVASHNELTLLPNDIFEEIPGIFKVDLSYNQLDNLSSQIFKPIKNVRKLYLQNNRITILDKDVFSSLTKLTNFSLSFNNIGCIDENIFDGMKKLIELRMSSAFNPYYNSTNLPPFGNLTELKLLYMDQNHFQTLPEKIFFGLKNLRLLNLANNRINFLARNTFKENSLLENLSLENNQLQSLDDALFKNLLELKYLNLANNQLIFHYGSKVFSSLIRLNTIILDDNRKLQLANSAQNDSKSILFECINIQTISARDTSVSEIHEDWFTLRSLASIDLTGTSVTVFPLNSTFHSKEVRLQITSSSKESVNLRRTIKMDSDEDSKRLIVFDKKNDCSNCYCKFHMSDHEDRIRLKCKSFDREKLKPRIPDVIKLQSPSIRMDFLLNNCSVGDSDVALIADYLNQVKVTKLSLSHNRLSSVKPLTKQLSNLKVLELDHNNFTSMDNDFIDELRRSTTLETIQLHGNLWDCSCSTKYFIKFVVDFASDNKIPNSDQVLCSKGGLVKHYDVDKDCDVTRYEFMYIAIAVAIVTIMGAIVVSSYYRYELEVKIWIYHHRDYFPSWFFPIDENFERWKTYDAFVCYAKKDEEFVKTRLRPKLEEEHPNFKLCLHQRDWWPGQSIHEQIHKSVADSRRTLIVLSHNFLNSDLCRQEFQVARDQSVRDKVGRIIVIMLEDIATHRLNDELKAYITKYTYIPWQDNDWFWNKLRYVLPHKVKIRVKSLNTDVEIPSSSTQSKFWFWRLCRWLIGASKE